MISTNTHNIEVSVRAQYWHEYSVPKENHYFFVYFITIKNNSDYSVQILKRHWDIADTLGTARTVDGDGIVGETPVLNPGQSFTYNSGCNLVSEMGCMSGYYTAERLFDGAEIRVAIPKFDLIVPAKLN
ncbi:MAG: Co2+/Mg2+ efflux protein ApaG [Bacteroidetes bacterium]|nr:Co2+/Mg2+ efflux protein ApaG [Bacteroidota bacterium]